jgi:hypothetical protein
MKIYPKKKEKEKEIFNLKSSSSSHSVLLHFSDEFGPLFLPNPTTTITQKTRFPIKIIALKTLKPHIS